MVCFFELFLKGENKKQNIFLSFFLKKKEKASIDEGYFDISKEVENRYSQFEKDLQNQKIQINTLGNFGKDFFFLKFNFKKLLYQKKYKIKIF